MIPAEPTAGRRPAAAFAFAAVSLFAIATARAQAPAPAKNAQPAPATPPAGLMDRLTAGFAAGLYGRIMAAGDFNGRPGRNIDFVSRGSRLDESTYAEMELRREDYWEKTGSRTRVVTTLAIGSPTFHYNGDFNARFAIRNLFVQVRDLGVRRLSVWIGSRMLRGDDIYLLDTWPLDDLNTFGGGVRYDFNDKGLTWLRLHVGVNRPNGLFFHQTSQEMQTTNAFGPATVEILNRQRIIGSFKFTHVQPIGERAGIKGILYGEVHGLSSGQREVTPDVLENVPAESGFVLGGQLGAWWGVRNTHVNLFFRYARGLAAYGEFTMPTQLSLAQTTEGARELRLFLGGNYEVGPIGVLFGGYVRSFHNASRELDGQDVDEGAIVVRPHLFFREWGGIAMEASFQARQYGAAIVQEPTKPGAAPPAGPLLGTMWRFGVIPFLSPSGRGDYSRPQLRLIYVVSIRDDGARAFYPKNEISSTQQIEHYAGISAEWWYNLSSTEGW